MPEETNPSPKASRADYAALPLVYACSGCSSAAQLANALALRLDRWQLAEMSCIAGVGGDVRPILRTARSERPIIVLDGCPLHCAKQCLDRHGIETRVHLDLSTLGIRKRFHDDASAAETERAWNDAVLPAVCQLADDGDQSA